MSTTNNTETLIRVSGSTDSNRLAGSIISALSAAAETNSKTMLRSIGAGALNQAMKAIIIANGEISKKGSRILIAPCFKDLDKENQDRKMTAIEMTIELHKL